MKGSVESGKKLLAKRMEEFCDSPFHVDNELELGQLGNVKFDYCEFDDPDYVRRHKLASLDPVHWELMSIVFEHYVQGGSNTTLVGLWFYMKTKPCSV